MTLTDSVQRAALEPADLEVRHRARHAPAWMKRRIDAARQARGAVPLWGATTATTTRQRVAGKAKRLRVFLTMTRATVAVAGS